MNARLARLLRRCPGCGRRLVTRQAMTRMKGDGTIVWEPRLFCPDRHNGYPYCRSEP